MKGKKRKVCCRFNNVRNRECRGFGPSVWGRDHRGLAYYVDSRRSRSWLGEGQQPDNKIKEMREALRDIFCDRLPQSGAARVSGERRLSSRP